MRIGSALSRRLVGNHERQVGISLVEVLAAVFIVGLMSSLVVITLPQSAPPERAFANSLQKVISESIDRAIIRGAPVAIDVRNNVIQIQDWRNSEWNGSHAPRIEVDGKIVTQRIEPYDPYRDEADPELICDPTGLVTPVVFSVTGRTERWNVVVTTAGEVRLEER